MGFSLGGSKGSSKSSSSFNQDVFNPDAWNAFYGNMNSLFSNMMPHMNLGMGFMNQALPYMSGAADYGANMADYMGGGGSYGDTSRVRDNLYSSLRDSMSSPSSMGRMYESIVGGPGNTYVDPLVDSMKTGMMDNLDRMRSGVATNAANMGQGGSSRHAMQNAMLGKEVNQDMANMENALRYGAFDTDLNWKMDIARQADLARGQAQDRAMRALSGADSNRQFGMNFSPTMQNLGMGMMAPYMNMMTMPFQLMGMYANAMGDPTVLSRGSSTGKSSTGSAGFGIG